MKKYIQLMFLLSLCAVFTQGANAEPAKPGKGPATPPGQLISAKVHNIIKGEQYDAWRGTILAQFGYRELSKGQLVKRAVADTQTQLGIAKGRQGAIAKDEVNR